MPAQKAMREQLLKSRLKQIERNQEKVMEFNASSHIEVGDKVVVTTEGWFYSHDGKQYLAVYGTVHGIDTAEGTLGVKTNAKSTNWYLRVGNITIAGCQIHYVAKVEGCPPARTYSEMVTDQGEVKKINRESTVYNADELGEDNA